MPVTIEACRRPVMFELTQTADLSHWRGKADDPAWRTFVEDVRRMLGRMARPAGAPAQPSAPAHGGPAIAEPRGKWTRRAAVTGLAVAGGGAAIAYIAWLRPTRHDPDPRAVELYRRAQAIQKEGVPESMGQAIEAYKQAVAIDPSYAQAWGALALGYRYPVIGPTAPGDPQEVRKAARRALALDPGNADARLALIALDPHYRRWQESEAQLRGFLRDHRDSALGQFMLGLLLFDVGRIDHAVTQAERATGIDPARKTPGSCGRSPITMRAAIPKATWPWKSCGRAGRRTTSYTRQAIFRSSEASATTKHMPTCAIPAAVHAWCGLGRLSSGCARRMPSLPAVESPKSRICCAPRQRRQQLQNLPMAATIMALSGMVDELFAMFEASFFGGEFNGTRVAPPGPLDWRITGVLFQPALAGLRGDPRFASLLARIGLEDYWRKSGTLPDFRRS